MQILLTVLLSAKDVWENFVLEHVRLCSAVSIKLR